MLNSIQQERVEMTINTKYNINDNIYTMHDNKVLIGYITSILIRTIADHKGNIITEIRYETKSSRCLNESVVFPSKEELLATL